MKSLIKVQFYYFRKLIQKRFLYLISLIMATQFILAIQIMENPRGSTIASMFYGVSFEDVDSHRVQIPVFWFCYFVIPLFIISDGMQKLWAKHLVQLKGMRFSQLQFGLINLLFLYAITILYVVITFLVFGFCNKLINGADKWFEVPGISEPYVFFFIVLGTVLLLIMIQSVGALFNPIIGMTVPIVVLLVTAYTAFKWNIFNLSMLARLPHYPSVPYYYLFVVLVVISMIYLQLYKKKSL